MYIMESDADSSSRSSPTAHSIDSCYSDASFQPVLAATATTEGLIVDETAMGIYTPANGAEIYHNNTHTETPPSLLDHAVLIDHQQQQLQYEGDSISPVQLTGNQGDNIHHIAAIHQPQSFYQDSLLYPEHQLYGTPQQTLPSDGQFSPQYSSPDSGYNEGIPLTPCMSFDGYGNPYGHDGFEFGSGYAQSNITKPKRKRIITVGQRKAANVRERKRMYTLNESFDRLRKIVPTFSYERKLSRIETLRLAITYIKFMQEVVDGKDPTEVELPKQNRELIAMHRVLQETLSNHSSCASNSSLSLSSSDHE